MSSSAGEQHFCVGSSYSLEVKSPNFSSSPDFLLSRFVYERNQVELKEILVEEVGNEKEQKENKEENKKKADGRKEKKEQIKQKVVSVTPCRFAYAFRTAKRPFKTGLMLVGWGGNNGTTLTCGLLANKHKISWETKEGSKKANFFGSVTQCGTVRIGADEKGRQIFLPLKKLVPLVDPKQLVVGGWDVRKGDLAERTEKARVLDWDLQQRLRPLLLPLHPLPSISYPGFVARRQEEQQDHLLKNAAKQQDLERIRADIRRFKQQNGLDKVIVMWTASTERQTKVAPGLNLTAAEILAAIRNNEAEVAPSQVFAVASILEGCSFLNGSPQNTFCPGIVDLAVQKGVFLGGDDLKSGQTKLKSVLVDFLVSAALKPLSIVSYNHLGNNDGKNLSEAAQFESKEISKSTVVDDMVCSNSFLFPREENGNGQTGQSSKPEHLVVIKYVPSAGDTKKALDEYCSELFLGGKNFLSIINSCEDSLLAAPIMLDLVVLTELFHRVTYWTGEEKGQGQAKHFHPILSILSYFLKAPLVPANTPVVNSLTRQYRCLVNILSALAGLAIDNDMLLEFKTDLPAPLPSEGRSKL